ncbi:hypothetical protein PTNB73_01359 [Pyrenophora teres f. teres]|uniref:Uncharacterized protein n=1 Tax=Pyrenophora teres f. teres TaxID=97479 RepID=A0A6S6VCD2_9PLEO|nr:hypothetical protein PTNB85_00046 [Pyrenophora teres f. teres]KAE8852343.1 hypothetical protein HRS9122_02630 [Pyrenophora teres f. teres]KAE8871017.1 hypothetical protein PTNB29_01361 [Pyrenophora teres f. teres]KAE8874727.1 hypothetical protein PTNB73_01359 [Pyrenophora teres f. teres]CAE7016073.1 hypothetical protein PTTW11_02898 [Pyrenophora teres f. teres]
MSSRHDSLVAAGAAAPSLNHWQSDPGYLTLPADLRSLVSGVSKMPGVTAHEAVLPFLSLLRKLPPVRRIVGDFDGDIDATAPLHWATKGHLPLSGTKLLELVVSEMNSGRSAKFQSGHLVDPVEGPSNAVLNTRVLSHMIVPSPDSAELTYAANIDGQSKDFHVRVPDALFLHRHFDVEDVAGKYSSNMTPQGTVVDLHRDRMDVFSVCSNWKLWMFFPSTSHNLSLLERNVKYTKRLQRLHEKLEGGQYAIVSEDEACYILAGYLHATYSLKSSCTVGSSWSSAEALAAAVDILVAELRPSAEVRVATQHDLYYFLRSLIQAFHCEMYETCRDAMQKVCWQKLNVLGKRGALLGPGWGLKAAASRRSISDLVQSVMEAVAGSARPEGFWLCDETGCESVVDHIQPKGQL